MPNRTTHATRPSKPANPDMRVPISRDLAEQVDDVLARMTALGVTVNRATFARKGMELAVAYYRDFAARLEGAQTAK